LFAPLATLDPRISQSLDFFRRGLLGNIERLKVWQPLRRQLTDLSTLPFNLIAAKLSVLLDFNAAAIDVSRKVVQPPN
jgi:hypothetical protein